MKEFQSERTYRTRHKKTNLDAFNATRVGQNKSSAKSRKIWTGLIHIYANIDSITIRICFFLEN